MSSISESEWVRERELADLCPHDLKVRAEGHFADAGDTDLVSCPIKNNKSRKSVNQIKMNTVVLIERNHSK